MPKQTIIIIIDDLGIGGAEILLIGILPELNQRYNVVLVTLTDKCDFKDAEIICSQKYILQFTNKFSIINCVQKLKKIIRQHNPSIVHSHLVYSNLISRIACPLNIPLVYTLHSPLSKDVFDNSRIFTFLEKNTIKKNHSVIAVSQEVLADYKKTIKKIKCCFILSNYIGNQFLQQKIIYKDYNHLDQLKLVAVGNIKAIKNYSYLVNVFSHLKQYPVTLDIYGKDQEDLMKSMQKKAASQHLPITFKGKADNINTLLVNYDVYVLPSKFEGFAIAAVEAMALGLPLLLSDLPVLKEVTNNNALFFDVNDPMSFVSLIKDIFNKKYDLNKLSENGITIARNKYTKEAHLKKLFTIYDELIISNKIN